MSENERKLEPGTPIYDLIDTLEEGPRSGERIYDLVDVVGGDLFASSSDPDNYRDEIFRRVTEIAEKVAREIVPDIAERVIREEIEKLKAHYPDEH